MHGHVHNTRWEWLLYELQKSNLALRKYPQRGANGQWTRQSLCAAEQLNNRDCDSHDLAVNDDGRLIFVNTLFNCLATTSETNSFKPYWQPSFIDQLIPEDQCHLNGLCMRDGKPAYATAVSCSNQTDGWRQHRKDGGIVLDVVSNTVIASGLSMPHSPRWHQDQLWICNSGTGEFGTVDLATGKFAPLTFCPGFMRELDFHDNFAIIGISKPRDNKSFVGLDLDSALIESNQTSQCGVLIVDLRSHEIIHRITFDGLIDDYTTSPASRIAQTQC